MKAELCTKVKASTLLGERMLTPPRPVVLEYSVELIAECGCKEVRSSDEVSGCRCGQHRDQTPFTEGQQGVLSDISRQLADAFAPEASR